MATVTDDILCDLIGNRTKAYLKSATATTYLYNPVNELTKVDTTEYEYDAAGNLTKGDSQYYYWDYENRLTKVKLVDDGSDVAEYTYDALGRRVEKIDKTGETDVTTRFYYDGWSVIEERDGGGTLQATCINDPTRRDEYIVMNRDSTDYWYMRSCIIGNVAALVDSSGAIQEGYTYGVYGSATVHTGAGDDETWFTADDVTGTTSAIGNPYMFTGRRYDPETGLYYFRFRMYDPSTGTFISRDPQLYVDGMSLYLYAVVRSLLFVDPFGLSSKCNPLNPLGWIGGLFDAVGGAMEDSGLPGVAQVGGLAGGVGDLAYGAGDLGEDFVGDSLGLLGGLLNFDEDESFLEGLAETLGHLTWGAPNTALGLLIGAMNVLTGGDVSQPMNDMALVQGGLLNDLFDSVFTLGPYVNARSSLNPAQDTDGYWYIDNQGTPRPFNVPVLNHEWGHIVQSLLFGPAYLPLAISAGTGSNLYNWFDAMANIIACGASAFPGL